MKTLTAIILLLSLFFTLFSCKEDDDKELDQNVKNESFAEVVSNGGVPEPVVEKEEIQDSTTSEELLPDQSVWKCVTKKYSVVDGNSEFPLFNPNASVIYPGSLLQGKTLKNASPSIIPVKRAGGTISIDIIDGSAQPSFSVEEVTKGSIATAANKIIGESTGIVPANFNFTVEQVQSTEQLAINLGLDVKTQFVEVAAQFSFRKDKE
ncbi:MAG TPA: thiol-activated cytolysin family protein, partial [Cytophagales bacterium]|nr:thiol-activated cytolysin family protein [Cytophagales bacterium]